MRLELIDFQYNRHSTCTQQANAQREKNTQIVYDYIARRRGPVPGHHKRAVGAGVRSSGSGSVQRTVLVSALGTIHSNTRSLPRAYAVLMDLARRGPVPGRRAGWSP